MGRRPTIVDIIEAKRDGAEIDATDIGRLVGDFTSGQVPDYQMSAWLMAVCLRGMSDAETIALTDAMAHSGRVIDLSQVLGVPVDKHSTGGVADTTTLVVAPLAAACGLCVAKMSGRGLGLTGGTIDKLESIPGYRVDLDPAEFASQVQAVGVAVVGQSADVDPADRAIYALRDVTGTVESIPLIVASIVSKKVAGGARVIAVDVKEGSGAFMKSAKRADDLARSITATGRALGLEIGCIVSNMDAPLGMAVGNAIEVAEAIGVLRREQPRRQLRELAVELVARLLVGAGANADLPAARRRAARHLDDGSALERFARWMRAQGGDPRVTEDPASVLPAAAMTCEMPATAPGLITRIDARAAGRAAAALGAGRITKGDAIDPAAGIVFDVREGDAVERGDRLATIFAGTRQRIDAGRAILADTVVIGERPAEPRQLLREVGEAGAP